ncbi:MAG: hypothetical protein HZC36_05265, partial [Armatimonadetes bacterium]|nr:hypothetical protein [Armatimonadota bacterium]
VMHFSGSPSLTAKSLRNRFTKRGISSFLSLSGGTFSGFSRESLLLINNVILVVAAVSVLLGTLYPLILDALNLGKISVGPPYFASVFVPLTLPLAVLIGIGPLTRWKQDEPASVLRRSLPFLIGAAGVGLALLYALTEHVSLMAGSAR